MFQRKTTHARHASSLFPMSREPWLWHTPRARSPRRPRSREWCRELCGRMSRDCLPEHPQPHRPLMLVVRTLATSYRRHLRPHSPPIAHPCPNRTTRDASAKTQFRRDRFQVQPDRAERGSLARLGIPTPEINELNRTAPSPTTHHRNS